MSDKDATPMVPADAQGLARAAQLLRDGGLVAIPTETVYGLAARADDATAVARIYEAKERPSFNPLIVHVRDVAQARQFGILSDRAEALAKQHWPGPLTLVVPRREGCGLPDVITAGLPTIALRVPVHEAARALLASLDFPLAAPSANRSGFISPTRADHVLASLDGRIDLVLDGGPTAGGLESTIAAVRADGSVEELRAGPIDLAVAGENHGSGNSDRIEAPGQLARHYAPGKPVRLEAERADPDEFMIGFGPIGGEVTLSTTGDLQEAAALLYDCLHRGARASQPRIAVAPVPRAGLGRAINDRLARAATPADDA
ncbi:L-threonylcarbamoyladenylate synthase [Erythrobacter sp.]|uniref:L-threonylcarbamoyladenylate synthase n=1 Tax=Erythrobacter sp. TaxID=1042 RepID=UPI003C758475